MARNILLKIRLTSPTGIEPAAESRAVGHGGARTGTGDEPGYLRAADSLCSVPVNTPTPAPLSLPTIAMFGGAGLLLAFMIVVTAIWSLPETAGGLMIVVAPPWSGGAEAVVAKAGGWAVGLDKALFSVFATGTSADALRASGAWAVFSADIPPSFLCLQGASI